MTAKTAENQIELLAYYISTTPLSKESILAALQKKLPLHMIPQKYKQLESFPIAKGGKIDKKSLPKIEDQNNQGPINLKETLGRDISEIELLVFSIWSKILKLEISHHQEGVTFYDLGGDSLNLIKMLNEVVETIVGKSNEEVLMNHIQKIYNEITIRRLVEILHIILDKN